ncbi:MAG: transposase [Chloroflexota bacterium]|nr:transposase [Chloroflexota bacterium]
MAQRTRIPNGGVTLLDTRDHHARAASRAGRRDRRGRRGAPPRDSRPEYGRIVRTNFLLVSCADAAERVRVAGQLTKGETLHGLGRHLVIGSRAQIPADEDDHRRHALCLQILVNAVQVSNASYGTASMDHLHVTKPDLVAGVAEPAPSPSTISRNVCRVWRPWSPVSSNSKITAASAPSRSRSRVPRPASPAAFSALPAASADGKIP